MKFLKSEHNKITQVIVESHRLERDFAFVKSKGVLQINDLKSKKIFTFYREEKTSISPDGQWTKSIVYFRNQLKKEKYGSLSDLLTKLSEWLLIK